MKRKISGLMAVIVLLAAVLTVYAQKAPQRPGNQPQGNNQQNQPGQQNQNDPERKQDIFARIVNIDSIIKKYDIEREQLKLEEKKSRLNLDEDFKTLNGELKDLVENYKEGNDAAIIENTKKIFALRKQVRDSDEQLRKKIMELEVKQMNEINTAFDKWLESLSTDKTAFDKYLKILKEKPEGGAAKSK